jgi:hypothetical protein
MSHFQKVELFTVIALRPSNSTQIRSNLQTETSFFMDPSEQYFLIRCDVYWLRQMAQNETSDESD